MGQVTDQRNRRAGVFPDFSRVHVDVDQKLLLDQRGIADRPVRHAGACHNNQVRFPDRGIAEAVAVISDHAEIQGILRRQNRQAHHRRYNRDLIGPDKFAEHRNRAAQVKPSARHDQRLFRLPERLQDTFDLQRMSLHRRFVGAQLDLLRIMELPHLRLLHVNRQVDQNRSRSPGGRDKESLLHNARDILRPVHDITVFHKRLHRSRDIRLLETVRPHQFPLHLACNADHRNRIRVSCGNPGHQIRRAGAGSGDRHGGLSRNPCISARLMSSILFLAHQHNPDLTVIQRVKYRADHRARIAENIFDPFTFQTSHERFRTSHSPHSFHPAALLHLPPLWQYL